MAAQCSQSNAEPSDFFSASCATHDAPRYLPLEQTLNGEAEIAESGPDLLG